LFGSAPGEDAWARQLSQAVDFGRLGLDRHAWAGLPRPGHDPNSPYHSVLKAAAVAKAGLCSLFDFLQGVISTAHRNGTGFNLTIFSLSYIINILKQNPEPRSLLQLAWCFRELTELL
jgi:hypothetical protein